MLPGQVHTYFAGSEQNVFRGYREELKLVTNQIAGAESEDPDAARSRPAKNVNSTWIDKISAIFNNAGLPTATQYFEYHSAGNLTTGINVYSVLHAPRGDGTEAIVLLAPERNAIREHNINGIALLLTLARYFKSNTLVLSISSRPDADGPRMVFVV